MVLAVGLGSAVAVSCGYDGGLLWLVVPMASGFFFLSFAVCCGNFLWLLFFFNYFNELFILFYMKC